MLEEAADIINALFDIEQPVSYRKRYFSIETARLWDRPQQRVPIGIAVSGPDSCRLAGRKADVLVAVEPKAELVEAFGQIGGDHQEPFIGSAQHELLPALRSL